jgi:hypothetical protein
MDADVIYFEGIISALVRMNLTNPSYAFDQTNELRIYNQYTAAFRYLKT